MRFKIMDSQILGHAWQDLGQQNRRASLRVNKNNRSGVGQPTHDHSNKWEEDGGLNQHFHEHLACMSCILATCSSH